MPLATGACIAAEGGRVFVVGRRALRVLVAVTSDVVTAPPFEARGLVNPANTALCGTRLPYFPVQDGGKGNANPLQTSDRWGGMEAGDRLRYPVQAVDGLVTIQCGQGLRDYVARLPRDQDGLACREGGAVATPAFGGLRGTFDVLVHTAVPTYARGRGALLSDCYASVLGLCEAHSSASGVSFFACPLLGAGARQWPLDEAVAAAVEGIGGWAGSKTAARHACGVGENGPAGFGFILAVQETATARALTDAIACLD